MLAALKFKAKRVRIGLALDTSASHTGDGTGQYAWSAELLSWSIFNVVSLSDGISMTISSASGTPQHLHTLDIPLLGISDSDSGGAYINSANSQLHLVDFELYEIASGIWRMEIGSVEWYIDGGLVGTYSGGTLDATGLGPGYVPLIGVPPRITGDLVPDSVGVAYPGTSDAESQMSGTLTGSYEFMIEDGGPWLSMPIALPALSLPSCFTGCPYCLTLSGILSGTDTAEVAINLYQRNRRIVIEAGGWYFERQDLDLDHGSFWIVPNLDRSVAKLGDSYGALIQRGGFPYTKYRSSRLCGPTSPPPVGGPYPVPYFATVVESGEVHPSGSEFLGTVLSDQHVIEDPLDLEIKLPCILTRTRLIGGWIGLDPTGGPVNADLWPPYDQDLEREEVSFTFPSKTQHRTKYGDPNPGMWAYLTWDDGTASPSEINNVITYVNYTCHPHWHYVYHARDWDVDGSPEPWETYWARLGDQWLSHPALPPEDDLQQRTSMVSAPLLEGGNQNFLEVMVYGRPTSWWGCTKLALDRIELPSSVQPPATGEDRWSSEDATVTSDAGAMRIDSLDGSSVTVDYDLADWLAEPRMASQLAKSFELGWDPINIVSVQVKAIGIDGSEWDIASAPGTYAWPVGLTNVKYMGTWAQDWGVSVIPDTGVDTLPSGDSIASMLDEKRVVACQLLSARGAKTLRFVIDLVDPGDPAWIDRPIFHQPPSDEWSVVQESRQFGAAISPNGPGLRFGQSNYWNYLFDTFQYPPAVLGPGSQTTVLDWLCFRRSVLQGDDPLSGLATQLGDLYVSGKEWTGNIHIAYDTTAWMMKWSEGLQGVLSNTLQPPPLMLFPEFDRDSELTETSTLCQRVWAFDQRDRYVVTPVTAGVKLKLPPGTNWLSSAGSPAGWSVLRHSQQVDNSEDDYELSAGSKVFATLRPWHGIFCVLSGEIDVAGGLWIDQTADGRFMQASVEEGDVWFRRIDTSAPVSAWTSEVQASAYGDVRNACFCVDQRTQRIHLVFEREISEGNFEVWRCWSDDDGATFGGFSKMADGRNPKIARGEGGALLVLWFVHDSGDTGPGTLQFQYQGPGDASLSAAATVEDASGPIVVRDEASFSNPCQMLDAQGRWMLSLVKDGETSISHWMSFDEPNFTFQQL